MIELRSGHTLVFGRPSNYQGNVAKLLTMHATRNGGCIVFIGFYAFEGDNLVERLMQEQRWKTTGTITRPKLFGLDLSDYVTESRAFLDDLEKICADIPEPIVLCDLSRQTDHNPRGWFGHIEYILQQSPRYRIITAAAFPSGEIPPNITAHHKIRITSDGVYRVTATGGAVEMKITVRPRRGVLHLTEEEPEQGEEVSDDIASTEMISNAC